MSPAAAKILERLQLTDRIVGIGAWVDPPAGSRNMPRVGTFDRPNVELILRLEAQALITSGETSAQAARTRLAGLGVRVIALDVATPDDLFHAIVTLGNLLGGSARAAALAETIRAGMQNLTQRARDVHPSRVLVLVGREPWYAAGAGSGIDAMIRAVGGNNVIARSTSPYPQVSLETIVSGDPDVIIDCSDNRPGAPRGRHAGDWARFSFLQAVANNRVYFVNPNRFLVPGPDLVEKSFALGQLIHAEIYGEPAGFD